MHASSRIGALSATCLRKLFRDLHNSNSSFIINKRIWTPNFQQTAQVSITMEGQEVT
jgi:hypothetical protein